MAHTHTLSLTQLTCGFLRSLFQTSRLKTLLDLVSTVLVDKEAMDRLLYKCAIIFSHNKSAPTSQFLISRMTSDATKVTTLIAIGSQRQAFKAAIESADKEANVRRVLQAAEEADKPKTAQRCREWLARHVTPASPKATASTAPSTTMGRLLMPAKE